MGLPRSHVSVHKLLAVLKTEEYGHADSKSARLISATTYILLLDNVWSAICILVRSVRTSRLAKW